MKGETRRLVIVYGTIAVSIILFALAAYLHWRSAGAVNLEEVLRYRYASDAVMGITFLLLAALAVYQIALHARRKEKGRNSKAP